MPHCHYEDRWVTADANGGLFRLDYVDGMIEPYEVYAFNALYMFNIAGELIFEALRRLKIILSHKV